MKEKWLIVITLLLTACSAPAASVTDIQTAIALTQAAIPTETLVVSSPTSPSTDTPEPSHTPRPSNTLSPTNTPRPQPSATPTRSLATLQQELINKTIEILEKGEGLEEIGAVNMVRATDGLLEIEVKNVYSSKDRQPELSYKIVQFLAQVYVGGLNYDTMSLLTGGDFRLQITTYSDDGDYKYQSLTDWETLEKINNKSISHDEWIVASGAGFK